MHCDDKRTAHALENNIMECMQEIKRLTEEMLLEEDESCRVRIATRISEQKKIAYESMEQLMSGH